MKSAILLPALTWQDVTPQLKPAYDAVMGADPSQSADHAFSNLCLWNELCRQELAFFGGRVAVRFGREGSRRYLFPRGTGELSPIVDRLMAEEEQLCFAAVTEEERDALLAAYPDTFEVSETRDYADYIYAALSLATLTGKKLHSKRNHINAFSAAHAWHIAPLTPADFPTCLAIADAWGEGRDAASVAAERQAVLTAFRHFEALALHGAVLFVEEQAVSFTVGAMITPDTLCVHFEKALPDWQSAYPLINREFVRMMMAAAPALQWVNREDDMGLENLRAAKLSYRPQRLLQKFTLAKKVPLL